MTVSPAHEAEIRKLAGQAESLRASIACAALDLKKAKAQERAISESLAKLSREAAAEPLAEESLAEDAAPTKPPVESTVITPHTLDAWRRRAAGVAIATAAAATFAVVAFTRLVPPGSGHAPPLPSTPAAVTVAPAEPPAAPPAVKAPPSAPVALKAPPVVVVAARRATLSPPANPYAKRTTPTPNDSVQDLLGAALGDADEADVRSGARAPGLGSLTVVCLPVKCDQIAVDGVAFGPSHIFGRPIAAGTHTLTAHAPNGAERSVSFSVQREQLREVRILTSGDPVSMRE